MLADMNKMADVNETFSTYVSIMPVKPKHGHSECCNRAEREETNTMQCDWHPLDLHFVAFSF